MPVIEKIKLNNDLKIINIKDDNEFNFISDKLCVTIGAYDGIHQGHIKIFEKLQELSLNGYETAVITFSIHPDFLLHKREDDGELTTFEDKKKIFEKYNINYLIILDISNYPEILNKKYDEFNKLLKRLGTIEVIVGEDFRYGSKQEGNIETLQKDFQTIALPLVKDNSENSKKYSSNTIREFLEKGDVAHLKDYMNGYFRITGKVIHGQKIGSKLGFPTVNLPLTYTKMKYGVYEVEVTILDQNQRENRVYKGICNVGIKPTLNDLSINTPITETFIFDFDGDLYGKEIEVKFIRFIRPERKFSSLEELKTQIGLDIETVKNNI